MLPPETLICLAGSGFGAGPATKLPLREVSLGKLFADGFGAKP